MLSYMTKKKKRFCRCEQVKDLEMGKLSWIIRVSHKCNHMHPYKKEAGEEFTIDGDERAM